MNFSIPANCTCKRPNETSPAMHSGTCVVWSLHHNLGDVDPVEIVFSSEATVHVGLWHPNADMESPVIGQRLRLAAKQWAETHGYSIAVKISEGWSVTAERTQTRHIFTLKH